MSEEKKNIPIEDGNVKEEEQMNEEEAKASEEQENVKTAEDSDSAEETSKAASEEAGEKEEKADEASAEEIESERYMRLMAEFQNFKKRAAKEKSDIHAFANERIINDLLPVLDNFERALGGGAEGAADAQETSMSEELAGYAKGMELIFGQLKTALEKAGLKEIPALGEDFDPAFHNAVMTESLDEYEDGKISKVMQKGYTLNDRVIRPSMVAVNKK